MNDLKDYYMAYRNEKGKQFERAIAGLLTIAFKQFNYAFDRTKIPEKWQRRTSGDVFAYLKGFGGKGTPLPEWSFLKEIHWECEFRNQPSFFPKMEKSVKDAGGWLKPILIAKKTNNNLILASMPVEFLIRILVELEGWRKESNEKRK